MSHMLEKVDDKLGHQLEEFDVGKLLELDLSAIMSVILLFRYFENVSPI